MDLTACIAHCRAVQSSYSKIFAGVPDKFNFTSDGKQLLFLSSFGASANSLYSIDLVENNKEWVKMLGPVPQQQLSRSEQLLQERMRTFSRGITNYKYLAGRDSIFAQDGTNCSVIQRHGALVTSFPSLPNAVDFQLCPDSTTLAACVCDGDIWLLDATKGEKHKLTYTSDLRSQRKISAGQPAFVTQEEFDRFTGYWWQPTAGVNGKYSILFEEVDETDVRVVHTFNPSSQTIENYNYPSPGTKNATSTLKLLKFSFSNGQLTKVKTKSMARDLRDHFPHYEYMTRVGWTPDGLHFWVQLLDRCQKHLETVAFPLAVFKKRRSAILPQPLWEERSPHWINVSNVLEFCPTSSSGSIRFLFSSEESGYRHLYWAETRLPSEGAPPTPRPPSTALTCGNWIVFDSEVCVNWKESVLFFLGNASSCLDKHLYAVQLDAKLPCSSPQQLTSSNYYHTVLMNTECTKFVDTYSNPTQGSSVAVFSVLYQPLRASQLCVVWEPVALPLGHCSPHFFSLHCETGEELHGCVFPPANLIDGHKYPTVHFVYGGPHFQMVSRSLCRFTTRIQTWTEKGFAVVIADNRGSNHRGVHFESAIARQFGKVEVEDQVLALKAAAQAVDYIDLNRVAVTGWSYGGYMSLMCLANAPSVYKLAIAGAAVVDWMSYDTGYTERYIGVPPEAEQAYTQSSVLTCVHQLPTEPNRLLVIHGMNDENVLFTHTSLLLDHLVKFGKPYALQVFTGERHGIRTSLASTHCDATILLYLLQHL